MTDTALRQLVLSCLLEVAPDLQGEDIQPTDAFRRDLDLDSMDFQDLLQALSDQTGVAIPDSEAANLDGLDRAVGWLGPRMA